MNDDENNNPVKPSEGTIIPVTIGQTISPTNSAEEVPQTANNSVLQPEENTSTDPTPVPVNDSPQLNNEVEEISTPTPVSPAEPITEAPLQAEASAMPPATPPVSEPSVGGSDQPPVDNFVPITNTEPKKSKLKKILIIVIAVILLLVAGVGAYFGLVVPSKPENVYNSAMGRSGKVFKSTVDSYTSQEYLNKIKKTETNANFKYESKDLNVDGKLNVKSDTKNSTSDLEINSPLGKITSKAITITPDGSEFPDAYFQVNGLKAVTPIIGMPQLESLDGKWIEINHTLFKQIVAQSSSNGKYDPIKAEDVTDLANKLAQSTVDRAFGTDKTQAVFINTKFVGKETVDGKKTNHYIVKVNKDNLKAYYKTVIETTYSSNIFKKMNPDAKQEDLDKQKNQAIETANKSVDSIGDQDTFDAWIDRSSKLIYKVKISDKTNNKNFIEIGQNYKKGDDIPMFVKITTDEENSKSNTDIKITANKKSSNLKLEGVSEFTGSISGKATYGLEINPYTGEIKAEKPTGTVPITDVLKALGIDPASLTQSPSSPSSVSLKADDSERQTDIKAIHSQLEAYFAINDHYPTLQNLNDDNWLNQNMRGLNIEALKDPDGSTTDLVASPAKGVYAYSATPAGCKDDKCTGYTLTATLSSGEQYAKTALN